MMHLIFPVGKVGSRYSKIGISPDTCSGKTQQRISQQNLSGKILKHLSNSLVSSLARISSCEYWTLDRTSTNQVRVILSWDNNSGCPGQYVTRYSNTESGPILEEELWQNDGNFGTSSASGNNSSGTITSNECG